MNWTASQSSNSGWLGSSPWKPKSSDVRTSPRPKNACHWRFTVTDNGIGIDERHRERIFGMFKRLHTRDAYPGTGIGLAVCKKIVERHRGTLGVADGPDGRGTTFWFTIPQQQEKRE